MTTEYQTLIIAWLQEHVHPWLEKVESLKGMQYTAEPSSMLSLVSSNPDSSEDQPKVVILVLQKEGEERANRMMLDQMLRISDLAKTVAFEVSIVHEPGNLTFLTI